MKWKKVLSLLLAVSMTSHASLAIASEIVVEEQSAPALIVEGAAPAAEETTNAEAAVETDAQEVSAEDIEDAVEEFAAETDAQEVSAEDTEDAVEEFAAETDAQEVTAEESEDAVEEFAAETDVQEVTIADTEASTEATAEEGVYTGPVYVVSFDKEDAVEASLEDIEKPVILLDAGSSDSRNIRDVNYVSIDTPVEINGETYQIVMAGIPDQYVDDLLTFIKDYYKSVDPSKIEYTGTDNLIDAEKWSVIVSGVDSNLCWAATASNMLWSSGWANMAINPRTGEPFNSEDEVFTFFTTRMTDALGNTGSGIEWFFNALYDLQYTNDDSIAKLMETDAADTDLPFLDPKDGLLPDLLAEKILRFVSVNGDLSAISILKDLAYDADASKSIGLSLGFHNTENPGGGGHAVTAFGIIYDILASSAEAMYKAIILADSDNDANACPEDRDISHFWEWMAEKETRKNAYQIYHLRPIEVDGTMYWEIMDYTDDERTTVINGFYVLDNYSDELKEDITETEGTCDFHKDYDLSLVKIDMANDTYEVGEEIVISLDFSNRSYTALDSDNMPDIPYSYRIIRDNEVIFTKNSWCNNVGLKPLSDNLETLTMNLQQSMGSDLPPGKYTIEFTINPCAEDNEIIETFYQNNTKSVSFTIAEPDVDPTPVDPTPVDPTPIEPDPAIPDPVKPEEESTPSYVTIPVTLIHTLEVENNGDWNLTKEEEKDYFTVKVFHPASEFLDLVEIIKDEAGNTEEVKVEKENYSIVDNNDTFTIEFSKEYLNTLDEGKHTFAISLSSLFERLTFDVEITK